MYVCFIYVCCFDRGCTMSSTLCCRRWRRDKGSMRKVFYWCTWSTRWDAPHCVPRTTVSSPGACACKQQVWQRLTGQICFWFCLLPLSFIGAFNVLLKQLNIISSLRFAVVCCQQYWVLIVKIVLLLINSEWMLTVKYCNFHCILRLQFWHSENLPRFNFVDFHSPTTTLQQGCATSVFTNSQYLPVLNFVNLTSSYSPVWPLFVFLFFYVVWLMCNLCMLCFTFNSWVICHLCFGAGITDLNGWGVKLWLLTHSRRNQMLSKILCFMLC